jgi:hypothetical protein
LTPLPIRLKQFHLIEVDTRLLLVSPIVLATIIIILHIFLFLVAVVVMLLGDFLFLELLLILLHLLLLDFSFVLLRHFYFIDTTVKLILY